MFSCTPVDDSADPIPHNGCGCCTPQVRSIARRIDRELTRRGFIAGVSASLAGLGFPSRARAQAADAAAPFVFSNFRLFDGKSRTLKGGLRLLVEAGRIKALATDDFSPPAGAQVIDCGGRTLMPGLIDAHWHTILAGLPIATLLTADIAYIVLAAAEEAERTLMRGFTTVRDLGGPAFSLKQAIDDGLAVGPRIYPSGAMITSSGGHGDLRPLSDLPRPDHR
jgi:imidazolonepropionase-like amidohydrolase